MSLILVSIQVDQLHLLVHDVGCASQILAGFLQSS